MDSTDSNVDLELIAALIDGRLADEDRARAMKLLADSDEALEIFAQAMRERQDAQEPNVVPIAASRRWRNWKVLVPVVAAAGLAIAIVPRVTSRRAQSVFANEYAAELNRDPRFAQELREGWERHPWSITRGADSFRAAGGERRVGSRLESSLSFRLGVQSLDLQVALSRGDTARAGLLTDDIVEALKAMKYADAVATSYTDFRSQLAAKPLAQSIARAADLERDMRDIVMSTAFAFGEWVGAADLATQTRNASFFASERGTRFIRSARAAGNLAPEDAQTVRSIDSLLQQGPIDRALGGVHELLQTTIRNRGG